MTDSFISEDINTFLTKDYSPVMGLWYAEQKAFVKLPKFSSLKDTKISVSSKICAYQRHMFKY